MANIPGTNLAAPIVPFTTEDSYPSHYSRYGHGGHRTVETLEELYAVPAGRREEGMSVWCILTGSLWRLTGGIENTHWQEEVLGGAAALQWALTSW